MQIIFGPQNAGRHIEPDESRRYEWRYFDALSDDGRFALVIIFFLGSPMSPYYARAISGAARPGDYWGVSLTLHENTAGQWRERAYAYNLYRRGEFAVDGACFRVGKSAMFRTPEGWRLTLSERGLWRGAVTADISFAPVGATPALPPLGADDGHTWISIAPHCRVNGQVTTATGEMIPFMGAGYHDGNFGSLPWPAGTQWYWGRILPPAGVSAAPFVYYHLENAGGISQETTIITQNSDGLWRTERADCTPFDAFTLSKQDSEKRTILFSPQWKTLDFRSATLQKTVHIHTENGWLLEGPFYNRWPVSAASGDAALFGIGEVFRPDYLTHPLWRIMMNTRLRRR